MIGSDLALDLPLLSDTLAQMVTKTSVALSAIEVSIADQATQAAINITDALTINGHWLTNVGGAVMVDGNNPTAPGSVYYHANEFYMIDATGTIKVTLNGALNVAGFGGIGGDYGGANPALVSYDTASGQYRFYTNGGTHAFGDLSARALLLTNGTQTTKFAVDATATNQTLKIGTFTATGAVIWDGTKLATGNTINTDWHVQDAYINDLNHATAWNIAIPLYPGAAAPTTTVTDDLLTGFGDGNIYRSQPFGAFGCRAGDSITAFSIRMDTAAGATLTFWKKVGEASASSQHVETTSTGGLTTWAVILSPLVMAAGERWWFEFTFTHAADTVVAIQMSIKH